MRGAKREIIKNMPSSLYLAAYSDVVYRNGILQKEYPDWFRVGFFCYSMDWSTGPTDDRIVCKNCGKKHWKPEWK